jgi:hypothetical protein
MRAMRKSSRGLLACALAALAALAGTPAPAQQKSAPLFRVELVVFRATTPPTGEDWTAPPGFRGFNADPATQGGGTPPSVIRIYESDHYQLGGMASKLRASGATGRSRTRLVQTATSWAPRRHRHWPISASRPRTLRHRLPGAWRCCTSAWI